MQTTHGCCLGPGGVTKPGEVKNPVQNIGEELIPKAETVPVAELGGDCGADDDFPVRKGENIGGRWVAEMGVVQATALAG